ncbi:MAG: response regulator [candidate division Zixibacteria bacterium]|nr:response regulator [candidate division Zixibacteria bacterium]
MGADRNVLTARRGAVTHTDAHADDRWLALRGQIAHALITDTSAAAYRDALGAITDSFSGSSGIMAYRPFSGDYNIIVSSSGDESAATNGRLSTMGVEELNRLPYQQALEQGVVCHLNEPHDVPWSDVPVHYAMVAPLIGCDMMFGFLAVYNGSEPYSNDGASLLMQAASYLAHAMAERFERELTDIELAKNRAAYLKSEERLRVALKNSPIIVTHQDRDLRYTWTYNLHPHLALNDPIGKTDYDLLPPEDAARFTEVKQDVLSTGQSRRRELAVHSADHVRYYDVNIEPLMDRTGSILGITTAATDVTLHKQIEQTLERSRRLEYAGQLAGQIAHDFNNLLGPLIGYPDLIRMQERLSDKTGQMLDDMESVASQMAAISQDLLTLGRRGYYNLEPLDIIGILDRAVRTCELPDTITVHRTYPNDVPNLCGGSGQMLRVFSNLLCNAADAMNKSGTITITVDTRSTNDDKNGGPPDRDGSSDECVRIAISDDGPGIPENLIDRIFEPFYTSKKSDKKRGSGLGLSVVKTVVEDHGGTVTVDSTVGVGTTFYVQLPVREDAVPETKETVPAHPMGRGETVLIVSDDGVQNRLISHLLHLLNYKSDDVATESELFQRLQSNPPELVLIDMAFGMEDMLSVLRQVRATRPEQIVLVMSGQPTSETVLETMKVGAREFLSKPVDLATLSHALQTALKSPAREAQPVAHRSPV